MNMKILIDTREQCPFTFGRYSADVEHVCLQTGDYSAEGAEERCAIERKSLDDLVGCLKGENRDRFERELARGMELDCFAVVVEASMENVRLHQYRSMMKPHAVLSSVFAFQNRYRCPFVWAGSRAGAEYAVFNMLRLYISGNEKK